MWQLADDLGLTVVEHAGVHHAGYHPGTRTVHLAPGRSRRVTRSLLAHEIAHHVLNHHPTQNGPLRARQEVAANEWAARRLIALPAYVEAERLRDGHVATMAHDLDVVPELITAYQQILRREWPRWAKAA